MDASNCDKAHKTTISVCSQLVCMVYILLLKLKANMSRLVLFLEGLGSSQNLSGSVG